MACRIDQPELDNTEKLLGQVLPIILLDESRALFLCKAGTGEAIVQRLRVMISRKRKELQAKSKRVRRFRLRDSIHQETHNGIRCDAVVLWRDVSDTHHMMQDLEGLLSHG